MIIIDNIHQWDISSKKISTKKHATTFINTKKQIKHIHMYEDNIDLITCPITSDIIINPIKLNKKYYEEAFIRKWVKNHGTDPLTNLKVSEKDLDNNICKNFTQKIKNKDGFQYCIEIEKVIVEEGLIRFVIKNETKKMNIHFNQIVKYKISGFLNYNSLELEVISTFSDDIINIYITHSNLSRTLFDILNEKFDIFDV
tara:strand:- start:2158 stop:2754 length:597 start_codon:yes stop_codon:yes gene_type:complete